MNYSLLLVGLSVVFFLLLLGAIQIGRRCGTREIDGGENDGAPGISAIEASVFALLGLLIAFTFSGAAQRMAERRELLVQEANAIGTAWLRIDMINTSRQPLLRDQFRRYVDERIDYYQHVANLDERDAIAAKANVRQREIWTTSMLAAQESTPPYAASYISAVNEMFDASTSLTVAQKIHPPAATYLFLGFLALICAGLVGMNLAGAKRGTMLHQVIYALVMTVALYIIVDFEFPRIGLIRIDQSDVLLSAQRASMTEAPGVVR